MTYANNNFSRLFLFIGIFLFLISISSIAQEEESKTNEKNKKEAVQKESTAQSEVDKSIKNSKRTKNPTEVEKNEIENKKPINFLRIGEGTKKLFNSKDSIKKSTQGMDLQHEGVDKNTNPVIFKGKSQNNSNNEEKYKTKKAKQGGDLKHRKKLNLRETRPKGDKEKPENTTPIKKWSKERQSKLAPESKRDAVIKGKTIHVPKGTTADVTIYVQVDSWYNEASWAVYDFQVGAYITPEQTFSSEYESQSMTITLGEGDYSVDCFDSYGDGGISGYTSGADENVSWSADDYGSFGEFVFTVSDGGGGNNDAPVIYDVYVVNTTDTDGDGNYEYWEFEIDIDASNGGTAEDVYIDISDDQGNSWDITGEPFTFEGTSTDDNITVSGWMSDDYGFSSPQDVEFEFYAYNDYGDDTEYQDVSVDEVETNDAPVFFDVDVINPIDDDGDGYYEYCEFEVDIDASSGGTAEDVYIDITDELGNTYNFGPYDFVNGNTDDNRIFEINYTGTLSSPMEIDFDFYASNNYGDDSFSVDNVPLDDEVVTPDAPVFYSVETINATDTDEDGYYEYWEFEIDIDASNGGTAEDVYIDISDDQGNSWDITGEPFDFVNGNTDDNITVSGWYMSDYGFNSPQDVEFEFYAYNDYGDDTENQNVPVDDEVENPDAPVFYSVETINATDTDEDGYYEYWEFELDIDASSGSDGVAENVYIDISDDQGNSWDITGEPFTFEGTSTDDNITVSGWMSDDYGFSSPQDVEFEFYAYNDHGDDTEYQDVPVDGSGSNITWELIISVSDNEKTNESAENLILGQANDATDGLDESLGENELPPLPPSGVFDARFILPNDKPSLKDYRSSELEEAVWDLKFQPGDAGYPFTFNWDPNSLPEGSFILKDDFGIVNVNMTSQNSFTLENDAITQLIIEYSTMSTMDMEMLDGWNIISAPLMADDMNFDSVFSMAASDPFEFNDGYSIAETMEMGVGYWLKFDDSETVSISGMDMGSFSTELSEGWNIIGPYANPVSVSELTTSPSGIIDSDFFGFNDGYSIANTLQPAHGYWVKASQAGTISQGIAKDSSGEGKSLAQAEAEIPIIVSDGVGGEDTLIIGQDPSATDGIDESLGEYEIPPLPPTGVFDSRLILPDDTPSPVDIREGSIEFSHNTEYEINWQLGEGSEGYTLSWNLPQSMENDAIHLIDQLGGAVVDEIFGPGPNSYTVTNENLNALIISFHGIVPVELSSFSANATSESVQLEWTTASEKNNSGFEVQRSEDNENFTKVGFVDGHGTTTEKQEYSFTDNSVQSGTYYYRLKQVDLDGSYEYSDVVEVDMAIPKEFSLDQNYPNPFNPSTTIKFALPVKSDVTIRLFNSLGQEIREMVSRDYSAGIHTLNFNAANLSSGIYFYSIEANGKDGSNFVKTRKMILMK